MTIKPHPAIPSAAAVGIGKVLGRFRRDLCVIQRKPAGRDAGGALLSGEYTVVQGVECAVAASGRAAVERVFGGRFGPEVDYVLKLPPATVVLSDDRITVNGTTMQVISGDQAKSYGFELLVAARATS